MVHAHLVVKPLFSGRERKKQGLAAVEAVGRSSARIGALSKVLTTAVSSSSSLLTPPRPSHCPQPFFLFPQVHPEPVRLQKRRGRGPAEWRQQWAMQSGHDELTASPDHMPSSLYQETLVRLGPRTVMLASPGESIFQKKQQQNPSLFISLV